MADLRQLLTNATQAEIFLCVTINKSRIQKEMATRTDPKQPYWHVRNPQELDEAVRLLCESCASPQSDAKEIVATLIGRNSENTEYFLANPVAIIQQDPSLRNTFPLTQAGNVTQQLASPGRPTIGFWHARQDAKDLDRASLDLNFVVPLPSSLRSAPELIEACKCLQNMLKQDCITVMIGGQNTSWMVLLDNGSVTPLELSLWFMTCLQQTALFCRQATEPFMEPYASVAKARCEPTWTAQPWLSTTDDVAHAKTDFDLRFLHQQARSERSTRNWGNV